MIKYDLYTIASGATPVAIDINTGYQHDMSGDETVKDFYVKSYNSVGAFDDSNTNDGWAADAPLLSITWDTLSQSSKVTISGTMEYTNDGGATWSEISGQYQSLNWGSGPFELRETKALGVVTKCSFYPDTSHGQTPTSKYIEGNLIASGGYGLTSTNGMFKYCENLDTLDVTNLVTESVTDMSEMFAYVFQRDYTPLDLTKLNTIKTTNMTQMFCGYRGRDEILFNFDTSNVTNMSGMFSSYRLDSLDLSTFNTSKVTNMSSMFCGCETKTLDVSKLDTSAVTDMDYMFNSCQELTEIDITNFDTGNVTNMSNLFSHNIKLITINARNLDVSKVQSLDLMFYENFELINLDITNWNPVSAITFRRTFEDCEKIEHLDLSTWVMNATDMIQMFWRCLKLKCITNLDTTSGLGESSKTNMFINCTALIQPDATAQADLTDADGADWTNPGACP